MAAKEKKETQQQTNPEEQSEVVNQVPAEPPKFRKEEEKTLFTWKAPARPFTPRDKKFWTTSISLAVIFGMILYVIEGMMPVIVMIAFLFLYYILTTVKPEEIEFKITNYGIRFADSLIEWTEMIRYWFTLRGDTQLMVIDTINLLGRLEIVISEKDKIKITEVMEEYLPQEEAPPSRMERASNWFYENVPEQSSPSAASK